jgi:hypothetical protein
VTVSKRFVDYFIDRQTVCLFFNQTINPVYNLSYKSPGAYRRVVKEDMAIRDEDELEYVQPTKTRKGYWRHKRYDRLLPSAYQRKTRALFAASAYANRGSFGKAEIVGKNGEVKEVSAVAKAMQRRMKGVKVTPEKPRVTSDYVLVDLETIKRIAETLREIKELGT